MPKYPKSTTRSLNEKLGEHPSLKDFGAEGDMQYFTASVVNGSAQVGSVFANRTGTINIADKSVMGTGTKFLSEIQLGQFIKVGSNFGKVATIADDTNLLLFDKFSTSVSGQPFSAGVGFDAATDIGKRIVVHGGGGSTDRESLTAEATAGIGTVDAYTNAAPLDAQNATLVEVAVNCEQNDVTWELFGADLPDYSDESLIDGPHNQVALNTSATYISSTPTKRYYRTKIKNKNTGQAAIAYVTCAALGRIIGSTIRSVQSPVICTINRIANSDRDSAIAYFGTDDTVAIQAAFDVLTTRVPPGTADGGSCIQAAAQGKYLISAPIAHRHMVTIKGHSGGSAIFQVDGEAFPENSKVWNMTGTFPGDNRIAFYTRLEDLRIHCGHVAGSIGVFADALQENSGVYRCTVIGWRKYGIQGCEPGDQYGSTNCKFDDNWVYPSPAAFADDSVRGFISNFMLHFTIARGTYLGQAGFICGFGESIDISNGDANLVGEIHCEAARIGVHFNTGSGGNLSFLTTQSHVQNGVVLEGGNPTICKALNTAGQTALTDVFNGYTTSNKYISQYIFSPIDNPTVFGSHLQLPGNINNPNVVTWCNENFGTDKQGGWIASNSRPGVFPDWFKTSRSASDNAMFLRLSAQSLEVRVGPANQPVYVATGICTVSGGTTVTRTSGTVFDTSWPSGSQIMLNRLPARIASVSSTSVLTLQAAAANGSGVTFGVSTDPAAFGGTDPGARILLAENGLGVNTPRINFDVLVNGPMDFGNTLGVGRARWMHGGAGQNFLDLLGSGNSGSSFAQMLRFYLDGSEAVFGGPVFPMRTDKFGAGIYAGTGSPEGVLSAAQGSLYLDISGFVYAKTTGSSGNTGWVDVSTAAGFFTLVSSGIIQTSDEVRFNSTVKLTSLTASLPLQVDSLKRIVSALIDLTTSVTGSLPLANGGTGGTDAFSSRANLSVYSIANIDTFNTAFNSALTTIDSRLDALEAGEVGE